MHPDSKEYTTLRTCYSSCKYEVTPFEVVPFGLMNGRATFQRLVNDIFMDRLDEYVTAFVGDLLIYSANEAEPELHVKAFLADQDCRTWTRHLCSRTNRNPNNHVKIPCLVPFHVLSWSIFLLETEHNGIAGWIYYIRKTTVSEKCESTRYLPATVWLLIYVLRPFLNGFFNYIRLYRIMKHGLGWIHWA